MINLTIDEVRQYLCIDYDDEGITNRLCSMIKAADRYLRGALGGNYPTNDARVKEIALMYIDDLWENRGVATIEGRNERKLMHDMELQVKLEMRRDGIL